MKNEENQRYIFTSFESQWFFFYYYLRIRKIVHLIQNGGAGCGLAVEFNILDVDKKQLVELSEKRKMAMFLRFANHMPDRFSNFTIYDLLALIYNSRSFLVNVPSVLFLY